MDRKEIESILLNLPEVAAWPEMTNILAHAVSHPRQDWELPLIACRAVGGDNSVATLAAAALVCIQLSITLVDDILDEDPRGVHLQIGAGATANVSLALQAVAFRLVHKTEVDAERRAAVMGALAQMALATAWGQNLDAQQLQGEANYWKTVRAKSTPFYGAALQVGALLGQAPEPLADRLRDLGVLLGEMIQIYDDLTDAFQTPANPDWKRAGSNLAILYALTAQYAERERFRTLLSQTDDPDALRSAQQLLIRCGAVSYCAYHVVKRYQAARRLLETTPLADPTSLREMLAHQVRPVQTLLQGVGAVMPPELQALRDGYSE